MRRIVLLAACLAVLAPASGQAARPKSTSSWAQPEIRLVVSRGMMAPSVAAFRPDAPLTQAALTELIAQLTDREQQSAPPAAPRVTIAQLDSQLVRGLGLGD